MSDTWRTGRSVGRTLYKNDNLAGVMDSSNDAARIVFLLNGECHAYEACALIADLFASILESGAGPKDDPAYRLRQAAREMRKLAPK